MTPSLPLQGGGVTMRGGGGHEVRAQRGVLQGFQQREGGGGGIGAWNGQTQRTFVGGTIKIITPWGEPMPTYLKKYLWFSFFRVTNYSFL